MELAKKDLNTLKMQKLLKKKENDLQKKTTSILEASLDNSNLINIANEYLNDQLYLNDIKYKQINALDLLSSYISESCKHLPDDDHILLISKHHQKSILDRIKNIQKNIYSI